MDRHEDPLYRSVNSRARGAGHDAGPDCRHHRNTWAEAPGVRRGRDYTPLFRFLLSKVGQDWNAVRREALARLDRPDPLYRMVATSGDEDAPVFRTGNAYFSRLSIDGANRLRLVDAAFSAERIAPDCPCCTHTFNGRPVPRPYEQGVYGVQPREPAD